MFEQPQPEEHKDSEFEKTMGSLDKALEQKGRSSDPEFGKALDSLDQAFEQKIQKFEQMYREDADFRMRVDKLVEDKEDKMAA